MNFKKINEALIGEHLRIYVLDFFKYNHFLVYSFVTFSTFSLLFSHVRSLELFIPLTVSTY